MRCGVCLGYAADVISIFNEEGARLRISSIIQQHFWFEPCQDDPVLNHICGSCWEQIGNFHIFYTTVKEAHKKLKDSYYKSQINDDEPVYTVEDSEDDDSGHRGVEFRANRNDGADGISDQSGPDIEESTSLTQNPIEEEDNDAFPGGALLFLKQEHEALLDQYTYVEKSVNEIVENGEFKLGLEQFIDTNDMINGNNINRRLSRSKLCQIEEVEKVIEEDILIAKHITIECEQCSIKLDTFNALNIHYQEVHNVSGYVRCCDKKLPSRSYILDHINQHINPENYKCKECNKSFSTQYAIKNHLAMKHAPESLKVFKCKHCPKRFTNDYSLNKHLLEHKNDEEKRLFCTDCGKTCSTSMGLDSHRASQHQHLNGHICHVCGTILKGKKAFGKHIKEHAATLGPQAIKDPVCPICGKLSASIKTLRHHIRYVHSAIRPHKCSICGKGFKIRQKLKEHMGTHAVGVSLPCPYCSKRFRSKIHVYSHKYRMHKKEYDMERHARLEAAANGTYDQFELSFDPTVNVCERVKMLTSSN